MRLIRLFSLAAVVFVLAAPTARAQGHANVFVGSNFSGDAGRSLSAALNDGSRLTWGGAIGGTVQRNLRRRAGLGVRAPLLRQRCQPWQQLRVHADAVDHPRRAGRRRERSRVPPVRDGRIRIDQA